MKGINLLMLTGVLFRLLGKSSNLSFGAVEKKNYPNLLVFCVVFFVALSGEYLDMPRLTRLEYGSNIRRDYGQFFFSATLKFYPDQALQATILL